MNRSRAFTLIELLVVVAIIALLIALLMPNLNKAKEVAKKTRCMANMKQIGTAFFVYAGRNNDMVPDAGCVPFALTKDGQINTSAGGNLLACSWPEQLFADGVVRQKYNVNPNTPSGASHYTGWAANNGIFYCLSSATHNAPGDPVPVPGIAESMGGYGMGYYSGSIWYWREAGVFDRAEPIPREGKAASNGQIWGPNTMKTAYWKPNNIVCVEGNTQFATSGMNPHDFSKYGSPFMRHMNGSNYLMGDGRVESSDRWHLNDYTKYPENVFSNTDISRWAHFPHSRRAYQRP
ncbi:MAG: prepilin-type N-terminal cleavage/methylation domain-containing protein [Phycisphaerales bacterium]|nr:prepilin-type N-terminal cleavage/methylation domain-containing protein [Phycisphaerales bacterium]